MPLMRITPAVQIEINGRAWRDVAEALQEHNNQVSREIDEWQAANPPKDEAEAAEQKKVVTDLRKEATAYSWQQFFAAVANRIAEIKKWVLEQPEPPEPVLPIIPNPDRHWWDDVLGAFRIPTKGNRGSRPWVKYGYNIPASQLPKTQI